MSFPSSWLHRLKFGRAPRVRWVLCALFGTLACASVTSAVEVASVDQVTLGKGAHFDTLVAGKKTYTNVLVKEVTVRSILITDTDGIASIPLRDLSPALQVAFGYDPNSEATADQTLAAKRRGLEQRLALQHSEREASLNEAEGIKFSQLLANFDRPPVVQPLVDLRPRFRELTLGIKNQGTRPSCSVFAIVSAFEFENAELLGKPEKLSEEYLIWATRTSLRYSPSRVETNPSDLKDEAPDEQKDAGFTLSEVIAALRDYGIAPQSAMPNTGAKIAEISTPSAAVVGQASARRKLSVHFIRGDDSVTRLGKIVQALNAGVPVPIGLRWPHYRTLRTGYIDEQNPAPNSLHAVTIVGYLCPSQELEETIFIFKNSYGSLWGEAGYGRVTYRYLAENLLDAVVLEVRKPEERKG